MDVTKDWFWEGNVVDALAIHLADAGWEITTKADTRSKERGVDIQATKDARTLLVEAKGFPSKYYRDPVKGEQVKPTNPTNQAQQWYSHALLKALRLQSKHPNSSIALAFPDFPRYRSLYAETSAALTKLDVALYFVKADRTVEMLNS